MNSRKEREREKKEKKTAKRTHPYTQRRGKFLH